MRRLLIAWIGVCAAASLSACGQGGVLDRLAAGETAKVASVQTGDALTLGNGLVVRLAGIEAPWPDEPGGAQALADLNRLALGKPVQLFYGGARRDAHGRALAQARLVSGRRWIEGALLLDGWARVRTFADNRALAHEMLEDEAKARRAKRGLWAMQTYEVRLPEEVGADARGFQIVEGRVAAVTPTRRGTYVDFSPDRRGFAVLIAPEAEPELEAAGLAPASLKGRLIRVRGMIGGDGLMDVDHPEPIELLKER